MKHFLTFVLREPLVHFTILGCGLFIIYGAFNKGEADGENPIVVTQDRLLTFMQYRAKVFDKPRFSDVLDKLPEKQITHLINDYIRQEALYREAKAFGLDKNNYSSRQRLIQQLEYVVKNIVAVETGLSEEGLQTYFLENKNKYYRPPHSHLFPCVY